VQKLSEMNGTSPYLFKQDRYSSHARIAGLLHRLGAIAAQRPYQVLDVGCASGFLRNFLPGSDFRFIGIERDPDLVEQARQSYDEVYQADLTSGLDLPLQSAPDAIVFADVLEHLPNPEVVLADLLKRYAKPGTPVIISLPNVAHLYVRLSLLLGRFEYADRGILDRTHLRFYTLRSAQQLCTECDLRLQSIATTPIPLPLVHPAFGEGKPLFPVHAMSAFLSSVFKGLLAFQFILTGAYEP
jgi:2-polyprenyl-3-methyl-5-hydroxy-6-metoxy-1,4-benzoquinol methylase